MIEDFLESFNDDPNKENFYIEKQKKAKDGTFYTVEVPDFVGMAEWCYNCRKLVFDDSLSLMYNGQYWEWLTKIGLNNFIWMKNVDKIEPGHIDNFVKSIKAKCFEKAYRFHSSDAKINLKNGIIDIKTKELIPHSNNYLFRYMVPIEYDKEAKCEEWLKTLEFIFEGKKDLIKVIQKLFGYVLMDGDPFLHKAFVLYGTGRNGKSTVLKILMSLIGRESYSSVSLSNLNKPFSAVMLDGKLANIVEETPTDEINAEIFKTLVGGGEIPVSHKGLDEYNLRVKARFIFACNDMPVFKDKSTGLLDRLMFIPFNVYIKEEDRDTEKADRLMEELPGILNWAMDGAWMVMNDRMIETPQESIDLKEMYKEETDPTYHWFNECIDIDVDSKVNYPNPVMYQLYVDDCEKAGMKPYSNVKFFKRLYQMLSERARNQGFDNLEFQGRTQDKKQARCVKNIKYFDRNTVSVKGSTDHGKSSTDVVHIEKQSVLVNQWEKRYFT